MRAGPGRAGPPVRTPKGSVGALTPALSETGRRGSLARGLPASRPSVAKPELSRTNRVPGGASSQLEAGLRRAGRRAAGPDPLPRHFAQKERYKSGRQVAPDNRREQGQRDVSGWRACRRPGGPISNRPTAHGPPRIVSPGPRPVALGGRRAAGGGRRVAGGGASASELPAGTAPRGRHSGRGDLENLFRVAAGTGDRRGRLLRERIPRSRRQAVGAGAKTSRSGMSLSLASWEDLETLLRPGTPPPKPGQCSRDNKGGITP